MYTYPSIFDSSSKQTGNHDVVAQMIYDSRKIWQLYI